MVWLVEQEVDVTMVRKTLSRREQIHASSATSFPCAHENIKE